MLAWLANNRNRDKIEPLQQEREDLVWAAQLGDIEKCRERISEINQEIKNLYEMGI